MKLRSDLTINGKHYSAGSTISPFKVYPFFLIHMLMFGGSGFAMAYFANDVPALFMFAHGGIAVFVYLMFYFTLFGVDEVKWMFINSALGIFGIYAELDFLLSAFDKELSSYPLHRHVIPFLYYVLYTFLIRQALIDISGARENVAKLKTINFFYIAVSLFIYCVIYLL